MNNNKNGATINATMDDIEENAIKDICQEDLESEERNNNQDITRITNKGLGLKILDPYFTVKSYNTTNKTRQ